MKIAYFDCFSGISGDMILGALIDAGLDVEELKAELAKLALSGYQILSEKVQRKSLSATQVKISLTAEQKERKLEDIYTIIEGSDLKPSVKTESKRIFLRLAQAEAKVHNKPVEQIHFHEVGAVDAIVDIVGAVVGIERLGIKELYASPVHLGTGFVQSAHGLLPVPSPATAELLKGVPVYSRGIKNELTTPTGAAILATLCKNFGEMPPMQIDKIGYGAGSKELPLPNLLRLFIGQRENKYQQDKVVVLETNIDDMNPQFYEHIMRLLFRKGAKDVFLTPVYMKKNRPGTVLTIIASPEKVDELLEIIFRETTTLGVRISEEKMRKKLNRESRTVSTSYGEVRVKLGFLSGELKDVTPEYDECKRIAEEYQLPIREVYDRVKREVVEKVAEENYRGEKTFFPEKENGNARISFELEKAKQFHGHLGPYLTVGLRIGQAITRRFGDAPFSFKIKAFTGKIPPLSCIVDGLQLSTPATVGNGGIKIMEAAEPYVVAVKGPEQLEVRLRPEVLKSIKNCAREAQEALALQLWTMPEEKLFQIKTVHLPNS